MGKFGIGARVRDRGGDEGVIVGKEKGERNVRYDDVENFNDPIWWPKGALEAVELRLEYGKTYVDREGIEHGPPEPKFKVGDRVAVSEDDTNPGTVTETDAGSHRPYKVRWDFHPVGYRHWFSENELVSAAPATPAVGNKVTLTDPATIRMIHGDRASVLMPSGGAFTLPLASLRAA